MSAQVDAVIARLKRDPKAQALRDKFDSIPYYNLPYEDLESKIERTHKMRPVRSLTQSDREYLAKLVDASIADQSARSYLNEVRLQAIKASRSLDAAVVALKNYLIVKYAADLATVRTKAERENIVNVALSPYLRYIAQVESLSEQCLVVIEDIDKAAWSLKLQVDALQIANRPERQTI